MRRSISVFVGLIAAAACEVGGTQAVPPGNGSSSGGPGGSGASDDGTSNTSGGGANPNTGDGSSGRTDSALAVSTLDDLPVCEQAGILAYVADERNLYACLDGKWAKADISVAAAPVPAPVVRCKWCRESDQTYSYDAASRTYASYSCADIANDGCGVWKLSDTCAQREYIRTVAAEVDQNGVAAQYPGTRFECYDPYSPHTDDDCQVDIDCGDSGWECVAGPPRRCAARPSWLGGTGTWEYGTDRFSWPIGASSVVASCKWGRSTYWFNDPAECTVSLIGTFQAPEGGLKSVAYALTLNAASKPATFSNLGVLTTNTTAAAHIGGVTETLDQITIDTVDFKPGGSATGSWKLEGTVGGANKLKTSGVFKVVLPMP